MLSTRHQYRIIDWGLKEREERDWVISGNAIKFNSVDGIVGSSSYDAKKYEDGD
jgi:hypothetical protein